MPTPLQRHFNNRLTSPYRGRASSPERRCQCRCQCRCVRRAYRALGIHERRHERFSSCSSLLAVLAASEPTWICSGRPTTTATTTPHRIDAQPAVICFSSFIFFDRYNIRPLAAIAADPRSVPVVPIIVSPPCWMGLGGRPAPPGYCPPLPARPRGASQMRRFLFGAFKTVAGSTNTRRQCCGPWRGHGGGGGGGRDGICPGATGE